MSTAENTLVHLSDALATRTADAHPRVVAIRGIKHQHRTGMVWQSDAIIASEQSLGSREEYEIVAASGLTMKAAIVGRDPGTNLVVLRPEQAISAVPFVPAQARVGELALALGADVNGRATARLGLVSALGPEWHSRLGGRIAEHIALDIRLGRTEEGGPVLNAQGALLGMSTLGPPGQILVIPSATIQRIVPQLLAQGRVQRGWLGLGLQPVAVPDALREAAGQGSGMMVMSIADSGPGANAGITLGDILLTIDGTPARRIRSIATQLDTESIGKSKELRVIRSGSVQTLQAMISAKPQSRTNEP